jgi:hypothetical protein
MTRRRKDECIGETRTRKSRKKGKQSEEKQKAQQQPKKVGRVVSALIGISRSLPNPVSLQTSYCLLLPLRP